MHGADGRWVLVEDGLGSMCDGVRMRGRTEQRGCLQSMAR